MVQKSIFRVIFVFAAVFILTSARGEETIDLGDRLELFTDSFLIDSLNGGATRTLHHPHDEGAIIQFDKPWEGMIGGYFTVIKDGDSYRLYYRSEGWTSVILSDDGKTWHRPNLGIFEFNGSRENNVTMTETAHGISHNFAPFIDKRPGVPASERYKALGGTDGLYGLVSEDGFHWKRMGEEAVIPKTREGFDSQNVAFWSESEKKYVCYFRIFAEGYRSIARVESDDFLHWSEPAEMTYGKTPREHLYTNQTTPYYRAPHIYLAIAARFMEGKKIVPDDVTDELKVIDHHNGDCSDAILMTTRGGNVYDRSFMEALIRPEIGWGHWISRSNYPTRGIVPTGENEMSIYIQHYYFQPTHELHRYSMRIDGLVSIAAPYAGGTMTTKTFRFSGNRLVLNYSTSAAGSIKIEILDEKGKPIDGFSGENAACVTGNWIDQTIEFPSGQNVGELAGKPVKVRFTMKDADLYSVQFPQDAE